MSVELNKNSEPDLGRLGSCLVEGDPEQKKRERRIRRRALAISVLLQSAVLVAIVLVPLFAHTERIVMAGFVPIAPYSHPRRGDTVRQRDKTQPQQPRKHNFVPCVTCPVPVIPNHPQNPNATPDPPDPSFGSRDPTGNDSDRRGLIDALDTRPQPAKPHEEPRRKPDRLVTQLDQAMLTHRVEPTYPALPRQMGRAGKVELRAIIATDGTIQSLQVVSGDFLFYQSALDAVRQWRYRPTYLNGQPVEVDTFITVVYTMNR